MTEAVQPYGDHAQAYVDAGWVGVLPLPPRTKKGVPAGYTGRSGGWPSTQHITEWRFGLAGHSIALRLPPDVIGIDVDHYGTKDGGDQLERAIEHLGPLPDTWVSTSRPAPSGIRLYRIPAGIELKANPLPHIEIIQFHHRYLVAWPSLHRDTGDEYRWVSPDGELFHRPPSPDELPELPDRWLDALRSDAPKAEPADNPAPAAHRETDWAPWVATKLDEAKTGLTVGSRHDTATAAAARLARFEQLGDPGSTAALDELSQAFTAAVTAAGTGQRTAKDAATEWKDIVDSARHLAMTTRSTRGDNDLFTMVPETTTIDPTAVNGATPAAQPDLPAGPDAEVIEAQAQLVAPDWMPKNLAAILAGDIERPVPTLLAPAGSIPLLYPGRVNSLFGESGVGKTWVTLLAIAQVIHHGGTAVMIDLEDTEHGIVPRLTDMGLTDRQVAEQFVYIAPETAWNQAAAATLARVIEHVDPQLLVIDSTGEAMAMAGVKGNDDDDVARWFRIFPRAVADRGPAVLLTDHIPKDPNAPTNYMIGSQRKRAAVNGASYRVDAIKAPAQGHEGLLKLVVAKDRHGTRPVGATAGLVHLTPDHGVTKVDLRPPDGSDTGPGGRFRPTALMERISRHLEVFPGLSQRQIFSNVEGKDKHLKAALVCLLEEDHVVQEPATRGFAYRVETPFREETAIELLVEHMGVERPDDETPNPAAEPVDNVVDEASERDGNDTETGPRPTAAHRGPEERAAVRKRPRPTAAPTPPTEGGDGPRSQPRRPQSQDPNETDPGAAVPDEDDHADPEPAAGQPTLDEDPLFGTPPRDRADG